MGFEYLVFAWTHYALKEELRATNQLEFVWQTSEYSNDQIFTHVMYDMYYSP